jgi:predicted unusual protein kinase regulating ubiquinone biosynthesis (AarF/ABC1/UbiB family)
MEYIEGPSLIDFMRDQSKSLIPGRTQPLVSVADLQCLLFKLLLTHKVGITHGDCHGGNIIRVDSKPPDFILLDFGHSACRSKKAYDFYKLFFSLSSRDHPNHLEHYRRVFHTFLPEDVALPPVGIRVSRMCQFAAENVAASDISWKCSTTSNNRDVSDETCISNKRKKVDTLAP